VFGVEDYGALAQQLPFGVLKVKVHFPGFFFHTHFGIVNCELLFFRQQRKQEGITTKVIINETQCGEEKFGSKL